MNEELLPDPHTAEAGDAAMGLWVACVEQLAQDLPEQQFNTWIKPLTAQVAPDFSKVTLQVATASSSTGSVRSTRAASRPSWRGCTARLWPWS